MNAYEMFIYGMQTRHKVPKSLVNNAIRRMAFQCKCDQELFEAVDRFLQIMVDATKSCGQDLWESEEKPKQWPFPSSTDLFHLFN